MPWFKVDDSFYSSPKVQSIPRGAARLRALGLWTSVGTWCAQHLTDGHFARHVVSEHGGTKADATHLVLADLWTETPEGYAFKNWEDYQPTRAQVETERRRKAEAGRKGGLASGRARSKTEAPASQVVEPPTRPDPSRPNNAAASASTSPPQDDETPPPLDPASDETPGPIAVLGAKMARHTAFIRLRWDGIPADKATRLVACIETLGDDSMVDAALKAVRPTDPPTFGTAFLGTWEALAVAKETGRHLRVIEAQTEPCPLPGHTGTTARCTSCIVDARVGDA